MLTFRIDNGSDKRLYLTKVNTYKLLGLSLICLVLDSDVKDNLSLVVQTDGWATNLACAESFCVLW